MNKFGLFIDKTKKLLGGSRKRRILTITVAVFLLVAIITTVTLCCVFLIDKTKTINVIYHNYNGTTMKVEVNSETKFDLITQEREYYTFLGWFLDENHTQAVTKEYFDTYDFKEDVHLYSGWCITDPIRLSFETNGGSYVSSFEIPRGTSVDVAQFTKKDDYTLLGWCYDSTLTTFYYPEDVLNTDTVLYAKWAMINPSSSDVVTVIFKSNGGTSINDYEITTGTSINNLPTPIRAGYTFMGWYADAEYKYNFTEAVVVVDSMILYAKWEENPTIFTITLDLRGGSGETSRGFKINVLVALTDLPKPIKTGDTFYGWYKDSLLTQPATDFYVTADTTLYAKYLSETFAEDDIVNVYFVINSDDPSSIVAQNPIKGGYAQKFIPTKTDYRFIDWYEDDNYTTVFDFTTPLYGDIYLYAKWQLAPTYSDENFIYEVSDDGTYFILTNMTDETAKTITIPARYNNLPIKGIKAGVFKGKGIESLTFLGANLVTIGSEAFYGAQITELTLPENIKEIGSKAFYEATKLTNVSVQGETTIGDEAFAECSQLTVARMSRVIALGASVFKNCKNLTTVELTKLQTIGTANFEGCGKLTTVNWSNATFTELPTRTFKNCSLLTTVNLPSSVIELKMNSFENAGLTAIDLSTVKDIDDSAFMNCTKIQTVTIGTNELSDKAIMAALVHMSGLKEIFVSADNAKYKAVDGNLYSKDGKTMYAYAAAKIETEFTVPDGVETIYGRCFVFCNNLQKITLAKTVITVQSYAIIVNNNSTQIIKLNEETAFAENAVIVMNE